MFKTNIDYKKLIGKKYSDLTKKERSVLVDKFLVTNGWCYYDSNKKFYVNGGNGDIVAICKNEKECQKQIEEFYPDEVERKKQTLVWMKYLNSKISCIFLDCSQLENSVNLKNYKLS